MVKYIIKKAIDFLDLKPGQEASKEIQEKYPDYVKAVGVESKKAADTPVEVSKPVEETTKVTKKVTKKTTKKGFFSKK